MPRASAVILRSLIVCLPLLGVGACQKKAATAPAAAASAPKSAPADKPAAERAAYVIRYEQTPCFGRCPDYVAEIRPDGTFTFTGGRYAVRQGEVTGRLSKDVVQTVLEQADAMHFDTMPADEYGHGMTDAPAAILTIVRQAGTLGHQVKCTGGECPAELKALHRYLDEQLTDAVQQAAGTARPTGKPAQPAPADVQRAR